MNRAHKSDSKELTTVLQKILETEIFDSQESILARLKKHGFSVNQSTISRLLRKLGVSKVVRTDGKIIYQLPKDDVPPSIKASLNELITGIHHNEVMVVINTRPGSAQLIGSVLDHQADLKILGNVAGDDTIFVTPKSIKDISKVFKAIQTLLLG